jgi:hypothetical protein
MAAPDTIVELVEKFRANEQEYMQPNFVEMQAREEFINPFFIALGWDVGDRAGLGPARCDVRLEETIRAADVRRDSIAAVVGKRPDYSFRIEGRRKFYVEAKKPYEDIERNRAHAFQVRAYGWSANLDISILTDFQQLSIYNCKVPPVEGDAASTALLPGFHMTYGQYAERWDEIEALLHREAVAGGSLEKYVEKEGQKRGVLTVDAAFLKDISDWRSRLALDIARRNPHLSQRDLNYAVQMIINRIIFLRICEDRGIEPLERLKGAAIRPSAATYREGHVYRELVGLFHRADERYNSGLFHFQQESGRHEHADTFTLGLNVGDDVLTTIISHLYHPYPYKFDAMPVEILGQVYEQFLGKVIVKQPDGVVAVEDKPEVRKAGGVYYTPTYIVDYIVGQTVGKLVDGKTPEQVGKLRVLDPACGSGSFLIGAYQHLLDWHLNYYLEHGPEQYERTSRRKAGPLEKLGDEWRLTIDERKRILRNNIYGVDIDTQAVEVTKLSLLLKVLEGETESTLGVQTRLVGIERVLPDLGDNIKAGNSLIGPDFYDTVQMGLFPEEEMQRINVFDWRGAFPQIMGAGGFDAVIGNPPYVFGRDWKALNISSDVKSYLGQNYKSSPYQLDMFSIFMEKAHGLTRLGGRIGQIVPNVWLTNMYSSSTRSFILNQSSDLILAAPPSNVFPGLTVDTAVYTLQKALQSGPYFSVAKFQGSRVEAINLAESDTYLSGDRPISFVGTGSESELVSRLRNAHPELRVFAEITRGVHSYRVGGYGQTAYGSGPQTARDVEQRPYHSNVALEDYRPFIYGRDLKRFTPPEAREYVSYGPWLAEPRRATFFEGERIYSRKILGDRLVVTLETGNSVADQQVYITRPTVEGIKAAYLAAIMGSKLISFFIRTFYDEANDAFPQIKVGQLQSLPTRTINFSDPTDKERHDRMVALVTTMLDLHKRLQAANTPYDKASIETRIKYTDAQIDRLVYELYGLTEEEIAIVEGG